MKRLFFYPLAALTALANSAFASTPTTVEEHAERPRTTDAIQPLARTQLTDAMTKALAIYPRNGDVFAFTLEQSADGTLFAQHRSHYSHRSHVSHTSHRSHVSSRW